MVDWTSGYDVPSQDTPFNLSTDHPSTFLGSDYAPGENPVSFTGGFSPGQNQGWTNGQDLPGGGDLQPGITDPWTNTFGNGGSTGTTGGGDTGTNTTNGTTFGNVDFGGNTNGGGSSIGDLTGSASQTTKDATAAALLAAAVPAAIQQYNNSGRFTDLGEKAAAVADPFSTQRAQYQQQLHDIYTDPTGFLANPAHQAVVTKQLDAIQSRNRASGYAGSGKDNTDMANYQGQADAQYLDQEKQRLAELSGAQFGPGTAGSLLMQGGTNAINSENSALATIMNPVTAWIGSQGMGNGTQGMPAININNNNQAAGGAAGGGNAAGGSGGGGGSSRSDPSLQYDRNGNLIPGGNQTAELGNGGLNSTGNGATTFGKLTAQQVSQLVAQGVPMSVIKNMMGDYTGSGADPSGTGLGVPGSPFGPGQAIWDSNNNILADTTHNLDPSLNGGQGGMPQITGPDNIYNQGGYNSGGFGSPLPVNTFGQGDIPNLNTLYPDSGLGDYGPQIPDNWDISSWFGG